jgi:hypothetical protein
VQPAGYAGGKRANHHQTATSHGDYVENDRVEQNLSKAGGDKVYLLTAILL